MSRTEDKANSALYETLGLGNLNIKRVPERFTRSKRADVANRKVLIIFPPFALEIK